MHKTITTLLVIAFTIASPLFYVEAARGGLAGGGAGGRRPVAGGGGASAQSISRPGMGAAGRPLDGGGVGRAGKPIGAARAIQRTPALGRSYVGGAAAYSGAYAQPVYTQPVYSQPVYTSPQPGSTDSSNYYIPLNP